MNRHFQQRPRCPITQQAALEAGFSPLQARLLAGRLTKQEDFTPWQGSDLSTLPHPHLLADGQAAAQRLVAAIEQQQVIGLVTDYDVDGVTSHAILKRFLCEWLGVTADHCISFIGHRLQDGYGVSPALTQRLLQHQPALDLVITADCGSSDQATIAQLAATGCDVIVTDHHGLPEQGPPPAAFAVVNPQRQDCHYPDKSIAGCMTTWLLLALTRSLWLSRHPQATLAKLGSLLDYVALGTVADCVSIASPTNRVVVTKGLQRLNQLQRPCWQALAQKLRCRQFSAEDLAFQIGPRINARSRLSDPYAALHFLLADDLQQAHHYLTQLDQDNQQRRLVEKRMVAQAQQQAQAQQSANAGLVIYLAEGHAGVQGIVASRLVEAFGQPAVVLCPHQTKHQLTGSVRGVLGFNVLAALQTINGQMPHLFHRFGGHIGAAGLTLDQANLAIFQRAFGEQVQQQLLPEQLRPIGLTDGVLKTFNRATYDEINQLAPYGRGFEAPIFVGEFTLLTIRPVGRPALHLSLHLAEDLRGIWFNALAEEHSPWPIQANSRYVMAFTLQPDDFRGGEALQIQVIDMINLL